MFQPITRSARIAKLAYQFRARFGRAGWIAGRRIWLDGRPGFLAPFERPGLVCAYFTGTDGPHRKTTAQIMTREGEIVGYAKLTRNPRVKSFLENEARTLAEVAELGLSSAAVPRLIDHHDQDGIAWLITDSLRAPGHVVARELGSAHFAFLEELAEKTRHRGGAATLAELDAAFALLRPALEMDWATRLASGISRITPDIDALPVALAHGDFTAWNTFTVEDRLYVFDWEYSHPAYPLGYDRVHFTIAGDPAAPAPALLDRLETEIAIACFEGDRRGAARAILFSLLLHAAFYLARAIEAGGTTQDWEEAGRRAALIDAVLARLDG